MHIWKPDALVFVSLVGHVMEGLRAGETNNQRAKMSWREERERER
jgi:hypothetical protein